MNNNRRDGAREPRETGPALAVTTSAVDHTTQVRTVGGSQDLGDVLGRDGSLVVVQGQADRTKRKTERKEEKKYRHRPQL
jgi:hypothetical protein